MPTRFSAPELVSSTFISQVLQDWESVVFEQMDRDLNSLKHCFEWLYQEALGYLCAVVLEHVEVEKPLIVSFGLIDRIPEAVDAECELVLAWSTATILDPGDVVEDATVTRVTDFPLPSKKAFLDQLQVRQNCVALWAHVLSCYADDLPQKEM